jgi:Carboxypeptidase regulatory-like domain
METAALVRGQQSQSAMLSSNRLARCGWLLFSVLFLLASLASGQLYTGSIAGTVTDPSGAVIPSARVSATDQDKGFAFTAVADASGRYLLRPIPPGKYKILAEATNFQGQRKEGVSVEVNQNVSVDFTLKVGAANQVVDVEAGGVALQTQDAVTGQLIDRRFVNDLPLVGRGVLDLAYLTPGITEVDTDCQGCMANNFISNGSRNATADILLDGVSSTNFEQNSGILAPTYVPSVDAVQEFKVQQSNFSAEFGFTGSTLVNVVTRSGTNQFHGTLYEFLRNDKLDANDWFSNLNGDPRSPLRLNDFGGTIGGPIWKNKTFFFFDYEGTRRRSFASSSAGVPTQLMRDGDFSELCTLRGASFVGGQCTDPAGQLWDPYSATGTQGNVTRTAFIPNNDLATYISPGLGGSLIDPVASKLMHMFPLPTQAIGSTDDLANDWFNSGTNKDSQNQFDIKHSMTRSQPFTLTPFLHT